MKKYASIKFSKKFSKGNTYIEIYINDTLLFEKLNLKGLNIESDFHYQNGNQTLKKQILDCLKLKKASTLRDNRLVFFSCSECNDIACGAVTIKIKETETEILWEDFLWEDGYEPIESGDFLPFPPIVFRKEQYFDALKIL